MRHTILLQISCEVLVYTTFLATMSAKPFELIEQFQVLFCELKHVLMGLHQSKYFPIQAKWILHSQPCQLLGACHKNNCSKMTSSAVLPQREHPIQLQLMARFPACSLLANHFNYMPIRHCILNICQYFITYAITCNSFNICKNHL